MSLHRALGATERARDLRDAEVERIVQGDDLRLPPRLQFRQVGSEYALAGGVVARLAEVTPLRSPGRRPAGLRDTAFAVVFESAGPGLPAGDRILDVSHAAAGEMKVYFSACGDACGGRRLQAIFN